jgi:hypothetical protein
VAKSNNSFSSLFRAKPPTDLIAPTQGKTGSGRTTANVGSPKDTRVVSLSFKDIPTGINFGSPSSPNSGSASGSQWAKLLEQTATGGAASAANGAMGLGAAGGLGSVVSSIFKLFGGGNTAKTLPPLVEFKLPNPESQTTYVSSGGSRTYGDNSVETPSVSKTGAAIYTNSGQITASSSSSSSNFVNQSAQIAQAVKNALLTSSSLNDVISEI